MILYFWLGDEQFIYMPPETCRVNCYDKKKVEIAWNLNKIIFGKVWEWFVFNKNVILIFKK